MLEFASRHGAGSRLPAKPGKSMSTPTAAALLQSTPPILITRPSPET